MDTAHRTAADAELKATIIPSPVLLNSRPPDAPTASRNTSKCSSRSSSARTGPTEFANHVEPTRSVTRIVASSIDSGTDASPTDVARL